MSSTSPATSSGWEPPLPEDLQRMLPQYEITGILGRGGMGAVYRGRQANLDRDVAIKVLPETFTRGDDELNFVARFKQEARAMAKLDHPAIISVYDFGETSEGQLYFVMEFIDGMDIHQYIRHHGGKLPQEHALSITAHVLDALDYAHNHGVIHRDIKPANILLNREGRVKIADFGLAKRFGEGVDESAPALTMSNLALGTPDFVAPEALEAGRAVDHRADLYAVGVMLYQMLTGRLPRGQFKSPSEANPEIDPRLDAIVSRAMQSDPDDRYASASAVRVDLDRILSQPLARVEAGEDSDAVPVAVPVTDTLKAGGKPAARGRTTAAQPQPAGPPPRSQAPLYLGIGLAAAVALGFGVFWAFGPGRDTDIPIKAAKGKNITTESPEVAETESPKAPAPPAAVAKSDPPTPAADPGRMPEASNAKASEPPAPGGSGILPEVAKAKANDPPAIDTGRMPVPQPSPTAGLPAGTAGVPPAPEPPPSATPAPSSLASLPGLKTRLDSYHSARRTQLGDLARKYLAGLEARLNQAADAGDLRLATAFGDEKARIQSLLGTLATPPADPLAAVRDETAQSLPALVGGSPEPLVALRQTWTTESAKIRAALDAALQQSLQALEAELTRARDFESAKAVLAWREGLTKPAISGADPVADRAEAGPAVASRTEVGPPGSMPPATGSVPPQTTDPDLVRATKDAPFENSLGMKFVPVPGTDVLFCIHETRWRDYAAYAERTSGVATNWRNQTHDGFTITDRPEYHPVSSVSWVDAQAFCAWLSREEGRTYRLPTDREWSIAVGIGREEKWEPDTTPDTVSKPDGIFPWGGGWPPPVGTGNYSDQSRKAKAPRDGVIYLNGYDDGYPTTAPVMSFAPNLFGLHDLSGNVWEWCEDGWNRANEQRVMRGSSWLDVARDYLLSSGRYRTAPANRNSPGIGFRVVLEISSVVVPSVALPPAPPEPPGQLGAPDPARASKDAPFENSLGMKFVPVPGTEVLFCIHETRYRDYGEYAKASPGVADNWRTQTLDGFVIEDSPEDHPVTIVSWEEARAFCQWLSEKEGLTYRLPTDREWSVAVGIGREERWRSDTTPESVAKPQDIFPWGRGLPPPKGAGNYSDQSRKAKAPRDGEQCLDGYDDGYPTTAPVMRFKANQYGIHDLGGNVWEWCEDWWNDSSVHRVLRGGSWNHGGRDHLLSSIRHRLPPTMRHFYGGFRVVVVPSSPAP